MSCGGGGNCCNLFSMMSDPCYQKLCCNQRRQVCYKPFIPSYERCDEEIKMGKLLGFDYQRRWFCERNVWMCKVYGQCGGKFTKSGDRCLPCVLILRCKTTAICPCLEECSGTPITLSPCCCDLRRRWCGRPLPPCHRICPPRCPPPKILVPPAEPIMRPMIVREVCCPEICCLVPRCGPRCLDPCYPPSWPKALC